MISNRGESVIVVVDLPQGVGLFTTVWGPDYDLTDIEVGWTNGPGLSAGGDGVTLFVGGPATENIVDFELYPAAPSGVSYDVVLGGFSQQGTGMVQLGTNIAIATTLTAGATGLEPAIGSPGNKGPVAPLAAEISVTEIFAGQAGADLTADWFELKNTGTAPWTAGSDPDLYYDDDSSEPLDAVLIQGIPTIPPGQHAIVLITGDAADVTTFEEVWGEVIDLSGVPIGTADGAGLGGGGDAVTIWLGDPNTTMPVDTAFYPDTGEL